MIDMKRITSGWAGDMCLWVPGRRIGIEVTLEVTLESAQQFNRFEVDEIAMFFPHILYTMITMCV